jgi:nucleotide-binding universal stress UspA family protein
MFTLKTDEVWEELATIEEECSTSSYSLSEFVNLDSSSDDGFQRRQSTLDLFSLQTPEEEAQFHKARGLRLGHIARELRAKDGGVTVQARLRGLRQYDACFVGAEAVDWLVEHRYARTRVEAVMLGNDLMDSGHFHHVADKTDYVERRYKYAFKDSLEDYYRFYVHEVEQPNQLQKRMEKREKLRRKHRRTKSEGLNLRDSGSSASSSSSSTTKGLLPPHHSEDDIASLSSSSTSSGHAGSPMDSGESQVLSSASPARSDTDGGDHHHHLLLADDRQADSFLHHHHHHQQALRSSSGDDVARTGSLPARVKSKVRQVVGEKLRPAWVEVTYPTTSLTAEEVEDVVWGFQKIDGTSHTEMELLASLNTLHKGDPKRATGNTYMVGLDGTEASKRALQRLVSHILKPSDYVYLIAIRERKMPDRLAMHSRNSEERVKWQFDLWRVARKILRPAHKELLERQIEHSALTPKSSDARKKFVRLARQYQVNMVVLGKHTKADTSPLSAVQGHFRKMTSYVPKHAKGWGDVLIF